MVINLHRTLAARVIVLNTGGRPDFQKILVTVAGQRRTCTGFAIGACAIRGSKRLGCVHIQLLGMSIEACPDFVKLAALLLSRLQYGREVGGE